jgi:hypothetical protein
VRVGTSFGVASASFRCLIGNIPSAIFVPCPPLLRATGADFWQTASSNQASLETFVKYFFLSEGWTIGRVWGAEGIWNEMAWRRKPDIERTTLCLVEPTETMWLYRVEDAVLMVEVKPVEVSGAGAGAKPIGQVVLKRLIGGDQVVERLCSAGVLCKAPGVGSEPTASSEQS